MIDTPTIPACPDSARDIKRPAKTLVDLRIERARLIAEAAALTLSNRTDPAIAILWQRACEVEQQMLAAAVQS